MWKGHEVEERSRNMGVGCGCGLSSGQSTLWPVVHIVARCVENKQPEIHVEVCGGLFAICSVREHRNQRRFIVLNVEY